MSPRSVDPISPFGCLSQICRLLLNCGNVCTQIAGPNPACCLRLQLRNLLSSCLGDPDQTIAGGLIDLGGFATLVHGHDLNRAIKLKVCIDLSNDQGSERLPLNSGGSLGDPDFNNLGIRYLVGENTELKEYALVQDIALSLEVRWSDLLQAPYVAKALVEIDGATVAELHSPAQQGRAQLTAFNFAHPLLQSVIDPDELPEADDEALSTADKGDHLGFISDPFSTPLGNEIWELSRELSADAAGNEASEFRIAVETVLGALPDLDRPLTLDLVEIDQNLIRQRYAEGAAILRVSKEGERAVADEYEVERRRRAGLSTLLDELMLGPIRIVIREARYKETLKACLDILHANGANGVRCEIHFCDHDARPPVEVIEKGARHWLQGVIPNGISITLYAWKERRPGEDFHARYLLTDVGGINVEAGFSAEGAQQKVQLGLLGFEYSQAKLRAFARGSAIYDLVEPVLEISSNGIVRRV